VTLSFLSPIYNAVSWLMAQIHSGLSLFMPSTSGQAWFLTIIVLVVLMRLVLVPLFVKQMHSMRKMSALTPQLQELRKKYKNDKQTLNEETMRLYKEAGVNPLGGCLPLLAQMPVFFALFTVLREIAGWHSGLPLPFGFTEATVKSAQNADILGAHISDKVLFVPAGMHVPLEAKIVILCFVAVSVVTTFMTVRQSTKRGMTPQMTPDNPMAASQKYMAYIVPFFALSGLYWAFGLVLYWVTTNLWTLGQQYVLFKRYPPTAPAAAGAGTTSPAVPAKPAAAAGLVSRSKMAPPRSATDAKKRPPQARPAAKQPAAAQITPKQAAARAAAAAAAAKRKAAYQEAARKEQVTEATESATEAEPAPATTAEPVTAAGKQPAEAAAESAAEGKSGKGSVAATEVKPVAAKTAAAKPSTAAKTGGAAKSATAGRSAAAGKPAAGKGGGTAKPAAMKSGSAKSSGSSSQRQGKSGAAASGTAQGRPAGQQASDTNGSGSVSGLLRRFGRGRAETEEEPETPEVKLVRNQRVRQSRSKRSGKR
jgi:YidC/Oxa1 family membrane protein insertase